MSREVRSLDFEQVRLARPALLGTAPARVIIEVDGVRRETPVQLSGSPDGGTTHTYVVLPAVNGH